MFTQFKNLLGFKSESESDTSEDEFSDVSSNEDSDDNDNDNNNSDEDKEVGEDQADFQRGDRCSFSPHGQKKWVNAVVIKYRYPDQFTLKIEGSGRVCLGIKRDQLKLPIKVIPISSFVTFSRGEVVDVIRKKVIRNVADAKKALEAELGESNRKRGQTGTGGTGGKGGKGNNYPSVYFDDDAWTQGQILKVTHDTIDSFAPPWYKIRFEGGQIDRDVEEKNLKKVFRKGDLYVWKYNLLSFLHFQF